MVESHTTRTQGLALTVTRLVESAWEGRIRVPRFQRGFRWAQADVINLFDSLRRGYPIGTLLLWEREAPAERVRLGTLDVEAPSVQDAWHVVDGQQRVTTLAASLHANAEGAPFEVYWDIDAQAFRPGRPEGRHAAIPLPTLFSLPDLLSWFSRHPELANRIDETARLTARLREYEVTGYVVRDEDEDTLRQVFDRMNNFGKRLSKAEVFDALHGTGTRSTGQEDRFRTIGDRLDATTTFGRVADTTLMYSFLARRGGDPSRDVHHEFSAARPPKRGSLAGETSARAYADFETIVARAIAFFQDVARIPHIAFLPYQFVFVTVAGYLAHFPHPHERNRILLRRWIWRALTAGPNVIRGSGTAAMRTYVRHLDETDEDGSTQALLTALGNLGPTSLRVDGKARPNTTEGRLLALGLWAAGPRRAEGRRYTLEELAQAIDAAGQTKPSPRPALVPWVSGYAGIGAQLLLPEADGEPSEEAARIASPDCRIASPDCRVDEEVWASHLKDSRHLDQGQPTWPDTAVERRTARIVEAANDFGRRMAEWEKENTPPLLTLDLDPRAGDLE
ncbi:MAG: DUF262 domain-containing protein [Bifidobacteriaceae bacterium]|jgi:hypothetical protein|nr:DUF262 domain-containing protein [Bifidobacteriaceae bacterium]